MSEGVTIVASGIQTARAYEKILGLGATLALLQTQLGQLVDFDPQLAPELLTVGKHISGAVDALSRAADFIDARLQAEVDNA